MKNLNVVDVRLTDALERQLLQEAIESQQEYALDRAIKGMFHKIAGFFKSAPRVNHSAVRTAH